MDATTKAEYETKSQDLRADLKKWEGEWAKSHNGRKPGREDIKANPDIARKYKQYNQVREILSGKVPPPPPSQDSKIKKRKTDPLPAQTPTKRVRNFETPSKDRSINYDNDLMNSPVVSRKLFSPASVTSLGPTPQRDGRVLGLFDLLVEKELGTPSKNDSPTKKNAPRRIDATPSKKRQFMDDEMTERLGRTPMSASKRQALNSFMTPLKNKERIHDAVTPSSVSKLQFDTPAFLKRNSLSVLDENGDFDALAPLRLPRKPLVRGLSEIVANLRKVEEEALDEDLEALREAEGGEMSEPRPKSAPSKPKEDMLAEDGQSKQLPLGGFDDEGLYDSPVEDAVGRDGFPLKVYKKKGQKRTTRKVNIKPTRFKRPVNMDEPQHSDDEDEENRVPETQQGAEDDLDLESDFEEDLKAKGAAKKKATKKPVRAVKKVVRKVNELAHANFQRLKLKNNGAKGGPGYNSRFRRRR
ncbi:DNA replication/checkpoint protein [Mariannaea sp. PMI_226]|nr:DNA replication/checkpoint protein [Mariannaea sp. PMI_226]